MGLRCTRSQTAAADAADAPSSSGGGLSQELTGIGMDEDKLEMFMKLVKAFATTKKLKEDAVPAEILPGVYLGSIGAANNVQALQALGVTHVLTVAQGLNPPHPSAFRYKCVAVLDSPDQDLTPFFEECLEFMEEGRRCGGVLVHCFAGRSRSATVTCAYLLAKERLTLDAALEHVKVRRPAVCPNPGFLIQLRRYEATLQQQALSSPQHVQ